MCIKRDLTLTKIKMIDIRLGDETPESERL